MPSTLVWAVSVVYDGSMNITTATAILNNIDTITKDMTARDVSSSDVVDELFMEYVPASLNSGNTDEVRDFLFALVELARR